MKIEIEIKIQIQIKIGKEQTRIYICMLISL
jgi:hypothetical protein